MRINTRKIAFFIIEMPDKNNLYVLKGALKGKINGQLLSGFSRNELLDQIFTDLSVFKQN